MRFHIVPLLALAASAVAQITAPKISADELVKSMVAITEAVNDAFELISDLPPENDAIRMLSKDLVDVGRGSSVVVQALPRPGQSGDFKYTDETQSSICDTLETLIDAANSLADGLDSATDSLPQTPELRDPIKSSVGFMGKALGGLVRRTILVTDCEGLGEGSASELREGFEAVVEKF